MKDTNGNSPIDLAEDMKGVKILWMVRLMFPVTSGRCGGNVRIGDDRAVAGDAELGFCCQRKRS